MLKLVAGCHGSPQLHSSFCKDGAYMEVGSLMHEAIPGLRPGVPPEETGVAVAAESSTVTLTVARTDGLPGKTGVAVAAESSTVTLTVARTDGLPGLDRYLGQCYHILAGVVKDNQ